MACDCPTSLAVLNVVGNRLPMGRTVVAQEGNFRMANEYIVPLIVAVVGFFQISLSLWAGRKNSEAVATRDEASATKEISEAFALVIDALETQNNLLTKENVVLRARIQQLEKEIRNGNSSEHVDG